MDDKEYMENMRKDFMSFFKKLKIINTSVILVAFVAFILIFAFLKDKVYLAMGLAIALLIAMFVFVSVIKRKLSSKTQAYVKEYYQKETEFILKNAKVTNLESLADDTMDMTSMTEARILKDINFVRSRNNVEFVLNEKKIRMSDLIFKIPNPNDKKKVIIAFCGKVLQYRVDKPYDGRTLIYRKTTIPNCYGPNDIEGLEKIMDDDKLLVYSSDKNFAKIFPEALLKKIADVEINENLYDMTISLSGDLVTIALSYADDIMVIPSTKEVPFASLTKVQEDITFVLSELIK